MKKFRLEDMTRNWFIGNFTPIAFSTKSCEVTYREYKAGVFEQKHIHKIATEITLVIEGRCSINDTTYRAGDIIVISPGEPAELKTLTDVKIVTVKIPSVKEDKYLID